MFLGLLEVGMDKKGEIDFLSKIIKPDVRRNNKYKFCSYKKF